MQLECSSAIPRPLDDVLRLVRDDLSALAPFLSDVDEIDVHRRDLNDEGLRTTSVWRASSRAAPSLLRPFLTPGILSWKEHAFWRTGATHAEWRQEPGVGGAFFECSGTTRLTESEVPGATRLTIQGDLRIHHERFPGVPRLLSRKLGPIIETFVVRMLVVNIQSFAKGVEAYFAHSHEALTGAGAGSR
jgi:hypothetical protein